MIWKTEYKCFNHLRFSYRKVVITYNDVSRVADTLGEESVVKASLVEVGLVQE